MYEYMYDVCSMYVRMDMNVCLNIHVYVQRGRVWVRT